MCSSKSASDETNRTLLPLSSKPTMSLSETSFEMSHIIKDIRNYYRPQISYGKVMFSWACVIHSVHSGRGWYRRRYRGGCVSGGRFAQSGVYTPLMVNRRAVRILLECVLVTDRISSMRKVMFLSVQGVTHFLPGGLPFFRKWENPPYGNTVNTRSVRILLERILVTINFTIITMSDVFPFSYILQKFLPIFLLLFPPGADISATSGVGAIIIVMEASYVLCTSASRCIAISVITSQLNTSMSV